MVAQLLHLYLKHCVCGDHEVAPGVEGEALHGAAVRQIVLQMMMQGCPHKEATSKTQFL